MGNLGMLRRAAIVAVIGGILAAGCGSDDDSGADTSSSPGPATSVAASATAAGGADSTAPTDSTEGTTAPADDDKCTADRVGGELSMGMGSYPPGLDPVRNLGTGANANMIALAIFDTLMRYDSTTDSFVPVVAKSLEPNADFSEWTLTLRDGVMFGNGDPLTADAVKTSFLRHQDPANRSAVLKQAATVTDVVVVDPMTAVFKLDAPWARFPALLSHVAGMITNPAVVDSMSPDAFNIDPGAAGVGPYELERFAPGEEVVLKAKQNWWGGPVCIQKLRFTNIPSGRGTYDAFKTGELQVAYLRDADIVAEAVGDGTGGFDYYDNAVTTVMINNASGPGTDPLVRQALAAAIDPDVINDRVYSGEGNPTTAIIAEHSPHYAGLEGPQPDAATAAELVQQAKDAGWDGNLQLLCIDQPAYHDVCITIQAMTEAAGMKLAVEYAAVGDIIPRLLVQHNFQIATFGLAVSDDEPWMRLSAVFGTGGTLNSASYSNPDFDAALEALRVAPDEDARKQALADLQAIWNEDIPSLIYQAGHDFYAVDDSVKGLMLLQNGNMYFDNAYIES